MACRQDCVGASVAASTNTCALQIKHGCGPGCTGLGSGRSMIQVDNSGNLVVCSNVGGVCSCTTLGSGEDSLTDNNNGTITHRSVAGALDQIDICNIVAQNCNPALAANGGSLEFTDIAGDTTAIDICAMLDNCALADIGDVTLTGPTANQVLTYNGADWVNADVPLDAADVCSIVAANCDINVTNNGNGTFTITDIGGADVIIDICQMIIDGGCNPGATDTLVVAGPLVTHTAVDGAVVAFNICDIVAANCNANVIDNGDGTLTATDNNGTPTLIDICSMVADGGCTDSLTVIGSLITHTAINGDIVAVNICDIVAANCNSSLVHAGSAILDFTNNAGVTNSLDLCAIVAAECDPSLIEVDGSLVFQNMAGVNTIIDICAMVTDHCLNSFTDTFTDNGDGSFTHTSVAGVVETYNVCDQLNFIASDCIDVQKVGCDVTVDLIVSPDDCNGLECLANGAYVNNDFRTVNVVDAIASTLVAAASPFPPGLNQYGNTATVTITNQSLCNDMIGTVNVGGMQLQYISDAAMVANTRVRLRVEFSPDGGITWLTNGNNALTVTVRPGETDQLVLSGLTFRLNVLGPGASQNILMRAFVEDLDGNFLGDAFITQTTLYAIGHNTL